MFWITSFKLISRVNLCFNTPIILSLTDKTLINVIFKAYLNTKPVKSSIVSLDLGGLLQFQWSIRAQLLNLWKRFRAVFPFTIYCLFYVEFEQLNVNKGPKWATEYSLRDWALVG